MTKLIRAVMSGQTGGIFLTIFLVLAVLAAGGAVGYLSHRIWGISPFPGTDEVVIPDWDIPGVPVGFGCLSGSTGGSSTALTNSDVVKFKLEDAMQVTQVDLWWARSGGSGHDPNMILRLELRNSTTNAILGRTDDFRWDSIAGAYSWHTYLFQEPVYLDPEVEYKFYVRQISTPNSTNYVFIRKNLLCGSDPFWYVAIHDGFWVYGFSTAQVEVVTLGHRQPGDGTIVIEGWAQIYGATTYGFLVSGSEEAVDDGLGMDYIGGFVDGKTGGRIFFDRTVVGSEPDATYYYRAYAEFRDTVYYGEVKSFSRESQLELPTLTCAVNENSLQRLEFVTTIAGIGVDQNWTISLLFAQEREDLNSGALNQTVVINATADGAWRTEVGSLTPGERYYYRARGVETDSTLIYSDVGSFVVWDPSQPDPINWLIGCGNISLAWLWWIIALIGFMAVWGLAGAARWPWLGVGGTFLILGMLIAFGIVSPWVTVLMAIVAGFIIFKMVFKHTGSTGS